MWVFRSWFFFPVVALIAAGLILASLGPGLISTERRPVFGRMEDRALVLDGESLSHPAPSADTVFHIARDGRWAPVGLRVAVAPDQGPAEGASDGLRILLAPERARELAGSALRVQVAIKPVPVTTAPTLAIGLDRGEGVAWISQPTTQMEAVLTYTFPPSSAGPQAIAIRPEAELNDYAYGVEIAAIRVTRAS